MDNERSENENKQDQELKQQQERTKKRARTKTRTTTRTKIRRNKITTRTFEYSQIISHDSNFFLNHQSELCYSPSGIHNQRMIVRLSGWFINTYCHFALRRQEELVGRRILWKAVCVLFIVQFSTYEMRERDKEKEIRRKK